MAVVIEKLSLIKFGKFRDFEIDVNKGMNVICGMNEAGKSTVNLFIKAMLYGMASRKKAGETVKERERAIPWGEKNAEGMLTVNNNGVILEIRRKFGKTAAGDKTEVCYAESGEKAEDFKSASVGEWLFKIPCEIFEKTLWISQNGVFMGGRDDELVKRVSNLEESGDEAVSAKKALERIAALKKQIKAADKRNNDGRLDELNKRLEECRRERYDLSTRIAAQKNERDKSKQLSAELGEIEKNITIAENDYKKSLDYEKMTSARKIHRQIGECDDKLAQIYDNEEYKKGVGLSETVVLSAQKTREKIDLLEKELYNDFSDDDVYDCDKEKMKHIVVSAVGAALFVFGAVTDLIIAFVLKEKLILCIMLMITLLGFFCASIGIKNAIRCNNLKSDYRKKKIIEEEKKKKINDEIGALTEELNTVLKKFGAENAEDLRSIYNAMQGFEARINGLTEIKNGLMSNFDAESFSEIDKDENYEYNKTSEEIAENLKLLRKRHIDVVSELRGIESKMAYVVREYRIPADIDTEINSIKLEIEECNKEAEAVSLAESVIKSASEKWKSMIAPEVNSCVNSIMRRLTEDTYSDVRVSDEFKIRVVSGNEPADAEMLSRGTYEQLYFALRMALSVKIGKDKPLFLDDILTTYDDKRAEVAIRCLNDYADERQVFLFTCHGHIEDMAKICGAHIIKV